MWLFVCRCGCKFFNMILNIWLGIIISRLWFVCIVFCKLVFIIRVLGKVILGKNLWLVWLVLRCVICFVLCFYRMIFVLLCVKEIVSEVL